MIIFTNSKNEQQRGYRIEFGVINSPSSLLFMKHKCIVNLSLKVHFLNYEHNFGHFMGMKQLQIKTNKVSVMLSTNRLTIPQTL